MKKQQTGIKETAFQLARKHGWELEYEGGLEIDGEYLDDADLTWRQVSEDGSLTYVLNISWSESTQYGFVLTREKEKGSANSGSSFGVFTGADSTATPFGNSAFSLPQQGQTVTEKYFISTTEQLVSEVEETMQPLFKK